MRTVLILLLSATACAAIAQVRPPTLDPTYGFALPKSQVSTKKLPPDAKWIWASETKDQQQIDLRKTFNVRTIPQHAVLFITADNYFDASINDHEIGRTVPEQGNDFVWAKVHRYDITNDLLVGANTLNIHATNEGGPAGVLARIEFDAKPAVLSGSDWEVKENGQWRSATVITEASGDPWGSRLEAWPAPLSVIPGYLGHLTIEPVQVAFVPQVGKASPLAWHSARKNITWEQGSGEWEIVVDFGKELPGRVQVTSASPLQCTVGTGESAEEAIEKPWTKTDLTLDGRSTGATTYTALRYATLVFAAGTPRVDLNVTLDHLYYPVEYRGSFSCSDPLLTKIWYTGAYTAHCCMQQDIWDAPKRDRMRWMGDLHVSGEVINNAFLDKFLMEQTLTRLREDAQGGKSYTELPKQHVNGIPGYSCAWVCGLADFYRHGGDKAYLLKQHDALIGMLEYLRSELDGNGLFVNKHGQWPFVDWSPDLDKDTPEARAATHFFLTRAANEGSFLLRAMGDAKAAQTYRALNEQLVQSAQRLATGNTFGSRRQTNSMAIYSGAANPEQTAAIWDNVLKPGSPDWNTVATPYYDNYVIFAMSIAGHTQEALDFVRSFWGGMIDEGATTFWEAYDPKWPKENFHANLQADDGQGYFVSLCHGWSAGATNFLSERVLGAQMTTADSCVLDPHLCDLQWAEGTVPTAHGPLKIRVEPGRVVCDVPNGMTARLIDNERLSSGHHEIKMRTQ